MSGPRTASGDEIPLETRHRNLMRYAAHLHAENAALRWALRERGVTRAEIVELLANTRGVGA